MSSVSSVEIRLPAGTASRPDRSRWPITIPARRLVATKPSSFGPTTTSCSGPLRSVRVSSPQTVEDACAHAWAKFMEHQPDRDRNWQGWLFRVAQFESWRLERQAGRDLRIRTSPDEPPRRTWNAVDPREPYEIRVDVDDAFSILERLPQRLRRIALLRALGVRPGQIGEITGDSKRRVSQLIARANAEIYEILAERARFAAPESPRAQRLWQLEHDQPDWLTDRIGRVPRSSRRGKIVTTQRAWRRAALALDDYRSAVGPTRFADALERPPRDPELRRAHEAVQRAINDLAHERGKSIGRGLGE
jgi:hypothetical protein